MRVVRFARETPCAVLLAVQLLGVLLYPFLEDSFAGRQLFALFGLVVLGLAIVAVRRTPGLMWVALTLAAPAVVLLLIQVFSGNEDLVPWAAAFEALLYAYAAFAMLRYMLDDEQVTIDELFAIGAVFSLLAWAFAHAFVVLQALDANAFTGAVDPGEARTWTELLFLSFTTLSSTGLSDIIPITGHARSVVMIEQVAGLFYIAMVVTRLVSLNNSRRSRNGLARPSRYRCCRSRSRSSAAGPSRTPTAAPGHRSCRGLAPGRGARIRRPGRSTMHAGGRIRSGLRC